MGFCIYMPYRDIFPTTILLVMMILIVSPSSIPHIHSHFCSWAFASIHRQQYVMACENIQKPKRYTRRLTTAPTVCAGQQLFWPLVPIWLFRSKTETAYWDGVNPELGGNTNRDKLFKKQKRAQAVYEALESLFGFGHFQIVRIFFFDHCRHTVG